MTRRDLTVCVSVVGSEMWMLVLACTLPLPAGYFMPVFVYGEWKRTWASLFCRMPELHQSECNYQDFFLPNCNVNTRVLKICFPGAALGRLLGEGVAYVSSTGVTPGQQWASINPGGYALAGIKSNHWLFGFDVVLRVLQSLYPSTILNVTCSLMLYTSIQHTECKYDFYVNLLEGKCDYLVFHRM